MIEGVIADAKSDTGRLIPRWIEGHPETSFWEGLKTKGKEAFWVETYRCTKCGLLKSYATEPAKPRRWWGG
jgi:hypothetical protein